MSLDLHAHTNRSDGSHDPADLVEYAATRAVAVLAITDHDTMAGVPEGVAAGRTVGVRVIPGIELSVQLPHGSMHLLGYFPDEAPEPLHGRLDEFATRRAHRARTIVDRLNDHGVPLDWQDVLDGARGALLGRPHIAEALVRAGHVASRREAFDIWLGDGRPANTDSDGIDPDDAVALIIESGGAPVLAHPATLALDDPHLDPFIGRLAAAGMVGIEVHRPEHTADQFARFAALARKWRLIPSGGSDYHRPTSPHHPGATGDPPLPVDTVDRLLAAVLR
ncbi:MAG: PHP domain-containing protein [Thermoleophilia bacterium]|nr:PHP domain-containing protein [Thermoleophilia bacterium]